MKREPNFVEQIEQSIVARRLFQPKQAIMVAVSGGLDSMVLLHALAELGKTSRWKWRLCVAHFNHHLRGRSSNADENLVRRTAEKLKLEFVGGEGDVATLAKTNKVSVEMAARKLRHQFFATEARKHKVKALALAHHADDQVELFFLRLLRGAGGLGLSGMRWQSPSPADRKLKMIRPLLDQTKTQLADFALQEKITFREDASNASLDFQRNRIRHELIPLLTKKYQPALTQVILRQMEILEGEADFFAAELAQWTNKPDRFNGLPIALQRRWLQMQLSQNAINPNFDLVEHLRKSTDQPVSVDKTTNIHRTANGQLVTTKIEKNPFKEQIRLVNIEQNRGKLTWNRLNIRWDRKKAASGTFRALKKPINIECFDADKVGSQIKLRYWQRGDRFQPIGMVSTVKLQDLFVNQKIPRERRHQSLIATKADGEIFWVEGLRLGERFKLDAASRYQLQWRWKRLC